MGRKKSVAIDPKIKAMLGFEADTDDAAVLKAWKAASSRVCKPCWELKYCPYGPLVEDFPLLPVTRAAAEEHNAYLRECLAKGRFGDDQPLDEERRAYFEAILADYRPEEYPVDIPVEITDMQCRVFGHICPVVFTAEGLTETTEERRSSRTIPRHVMMRVARRDNYTCQICGLHLRDHEIEFDHKIPFAKGGSSDEHNIQVTCFDCNRKKSAAVII